MVRGLYERIVGGGLVTEFESLSRDCRRFVDQALGGYEHVIRSWHTKELQDDRVLAIVAAGNDRCVPRCRDQRVLAQLARSGDWWGRQAAILRISDENEIVRIYAEEKEFRFQRLTFDRLTNTGFRDKIPFADLLLSRLLFGHRDMSEHPDGLSLRLTFPLKTIGWFYDVLGQSGFEMGTGRKYERTTYYRRAELDPHPLGRSSSFSKEEWDASHAYWHEESLRRGTVKHLTNWEQPVRSTDGFQAMVTFDHDLSHSPRAVCDWCQLSDPDQIRAAMLRELMNGYSSSLRGDEPDLLVPNGYAETDGQISWKLSLSVPATAYNDCQARKALARLLLRLEDANL